MQLVEVEIKELSVVLRRLRQLPERKVRQKVESLRDKGQMSPVVAAEHEGQLVLIDGFARHAAAERLGMKTLSVEVVRLSAPQMKAQMYLRNRERGLGLLEECQLIAELCDAEGLSQVEVASLLERHKSWVCRRLGMWKALSPRLTVSGELCELEGGSVRRLALLPVRNQEELIAVSRREKLVAAETRVLIDLWRRAPDEQSRRYVMQEPREAIELASSRTTPKEDPRLGKAGRELLVAMVWMHHNATRVIRRARAGIESPSSEGSHLLTRACEMVERDCPWAAREVRRLLKPEAQMEAAS